MPANITHCMHCVPQYFLTQYNTHNNFFQYNNFSSQIIIYLFFVIIVEVCMINVDV